MKPIVLPAQRVTCSENRSNTSLEGFVSFAMGQ
jgi:hypothetical protein